MPYTTSGLSYEWLLSRSANRETVRQYGADPNGGWPTIFEYNGVPPVDGCNFRSTGLPKADAENLYQNMFLQLGTNVTINADGDDYRGPLRGCQMNRPESAVQRWSVSLRLENPQV